MFLQNYSGLEHSLNNTTILNQINNELITNNNNLMENLEIKK